MKSPVPYDEASLPNKFWRSERGDRYLPSPGFVTDFVLHTRGIETPTILSIWTAIFAISSALGREAFLQWFPSPLYPNLFMFFVGPPKICAKSTAARIVTKILRDFTEGMPPELAILKTQNMSLSKATPESLSMLLASEPIPYTDPVKKTVKMIDRGSRLTLVVDELATFLGKQQYNGGLIDRLTHLYDSQDYDTENTVGRGKKEFHDIYVTFLGAATPDHLSGSIPEEAFGGGFMSRVILVYEQGGSRDFPVPRGVPEGPSTKELSRRLAWIAANAVGEYTLTPSALEFYQDWYYAFKKDLRKRQDEKGIAMYFRMDIHLLKLALILHIQRYSLSHEVTLEDLTQAKALLDQTLEKAMPSLESVGASDWQKAYNRVKKVIEQGDIKRQDLLRKLSPYGIRAAFVNEALTNLHAEGLIAISKDGEEVHKVSTNGKEEYSYIGVVNGKS